jgi:hypothetical protein
MFYKAFVLEIVYLKYISCNRKLKKEIFELFSKLVIQSIFYLQISCLSKKDSSGNEEFLDNIKWHNK